MLDVSTSGGEQNGQNVGTTELNVHGVESNVHARCQHPSETKSSTLGGQFSSYYFVYSVSYFLHCKSVQNPFKSQHLH